MKKIAIIGTHAIGKTYAANLLKKFLENEGKVVENISEQTRECPYPVNEKSTEQAQKWILLKQVLEEETKAAGNPDFIISDRSVIDHYAYFYRVKKEDDPVFMDLVREHSMTYDYLFLLPINQTYVKEDGFRSTDRKFQEDIQEIVKSKLQELHSCLSATKVMVYEVEKVEEIIEILKNNREI